MNTTVTMAPCNHCNGTGGTDHPCTACHGRGERPAATDCEACGERRATRDGLCDVCDADALAAPHPATASGLDGAHGARVLRASLSSARGIATRALMNAAADADDAPAALAAVYMHRDDGASSVHTLVATLTAVCEASRLVGAAADGVRGDITTTHGDESARRIAGSALGMMGPGLDALAAAVDVLRALDSEGGR